MKKLLLFILALSLGATLHAQSRADYDTAIGKFRQFYNDNQPNSIYNMFGKRLQQMAPRDKTTEMFSALHTQLGQITACEFTKEEKPFYYYKASFTGTALTIAATLSAESKFESFRMVPHTSETKRKEQSNFVYAAPTGNIYGTLSVPTGDKKVPVMIIIAGSGPTDRDGNQGEQIVTDSYKQMADSLLKEGIACLRYDKRGVGESKGAIKSEESTSFDDMVNDVVGMVKKLREDKRFSCIIILGHSEGSLIGMIAAKKEKVNGYISLAGAGESVDKILAKQLTEQSEERGARARIIMDSIMQGYTLNNIEPGFFMEFRPSVQPYLRSLFKYDPQAEIKKLDMPVLILQGSTDIQVTEQNAEQLKKACPKGRLQIINGMNHVLKQAPEDRQQNLSTYTNPSLPLSPGLMPAIHAFISKIK